MTTGNDAAFIRVHVSEDSGWAIFTNGLTKREYFAAMALQGILSYDQVFGRVIPEPSRYAGITEGNLAAMEAVAAADFLIEALNKEPK